MEWSTAPVWIQAFGALATFVLAGVSVYQTRLLKREHAAAESRELNSSIYLPLHKALDSPGTKDGADEPALAEEWSEIRRNHPHLIPTIPNPLRNALDEYSSAKEKFVAMNSLFRKERERVEGAEFRRIIPGIESKTGRPPVTLRIWVDETWTRGMHPWPDWLEDAPFDSLVESEREKYRGKQTDVEILLHVGAPIRSLTKAREYVTTVQANYERSDEAKQIKRQFAQMRTLRDDVRARLNAEFERLKD